MAHRNRKHHQNGRFINPHLAHTRRRLWHVLLWQMGYYDDAGPVRAIPDDFAYPNPREIIHSHRPTVTWINHTTFLITIEGITLLTDPIWAHRCSPLRFFGPKRLHRPPIALHELPRIDYVLISHDHYDHLDRSTIIRLVKRNPQLRFFVPLGLRSWFHRLGITNVVELDWWESVEERPVHHELPMEVYAVPAQHYSGRSLFDKDCRLWAGWVVKMHSEVHGEKRLYFVGDTGYNDQDFCQVGHELGAFDLSLIPIGAYLPEDFMRTVHASPEDAVAIHRDANSKLSVGGHWGTFRLSSEEYHQPPYDLYLSLEQQGLAHHEFRVLDQGQSINW